LSIALYYYGIYLNNFHAPDMSAVARQKTIIEEQLTLAKMAAMLFAII
jgi:hypothetical protein